MKTKQINLKMPNNLFKAAQDYAKNYGFRNVQELLSESIREKIFDKNKFDNNFTDKEIYLVDKVISKILKENDFSTEEEMNKILLK